MSPSTPANSDLPEPPSPQLRALEWLLIFALFALYAGWPAPDPNEPHYLGKAKAFWDQGWIQGDEFLDSPETHVAFYAACGWLTRFMPLVAVAWCGRLITWALLAWAWRRLSWAVVPRAGLSILSAGIMLLFQDRFHMAGEWVVGGFEAKGIAYACVFIGLEQAVRNRWNRVWLWLGFASGWHVLVGGWATVATGFAWLTLGNDRPSLLKIMPGLLGGLLLALPGLIPAAMLSRGVDPLLIDQANQIYVFERIQHHLFCPSFPLEFVTRHLLAWGIWLVLCLWLPRTTAQACLQRVVLGAGLISVVGAILTATLFQNPESAAAILRFYWYRLADALLPVGIALAAMEHLKLALAVRPAWGRICMLACLAAIGTHLVPFVAARLSPSPPRADKPGKIIDFDSWRDACIYIRDNTPKHARVLTPRQSQTFKWYAERPETATWKDTPQDPATIIRWWQALDKIHATHAPPPDDRWYEFLSDRRPDDILQLAREYHADFLLTSASPELPFKRMFSNAHYAVYDLTVPATNNPAAAIETPTSSAP